METKKHIIYKKKSRFFDIYISKVLKQISENHSITINAKEQLNSIICIILKNIVTIVIRFTQMSNKKTITIKEVKNAVSIIFPGELAINAISEGMKAQTQYLMCENTGLSKQNKAEIIFSVPLVEKFLRNFGQSKFLVSSNAPVFLAASMEYICAELLETSTLYANENRRIRITVRELELGVRNDEELNILFKKLNIEFIGGGVIPFIHPNLLNKKQVKPSGNSKKYKFRPGTVSIREIKKYQKTFNNLCIPKNPFEKSIRECVNQIKPNLKISKNVFTIIQYYIEQYMIDLLRQANLASLHAGRVKINSEDIAFVLKIRDNDKIPYRIEDSVDKVLNIIENDFPLLNLENEIL